jgi:hypothetical protein
LRKPITTLKRAAWCDRHLVCTKQVAELLDTYPPRCAAASTATLARSARPGGGQQRVIQIALSSLPMPARGIFRGNRRRSRAVQLDPLLVDLDVRECLPDGPAIAPTAAADPARFDRYYADRWRSDI